MVVLRLRSIWNSPSPLTVEDKCRLGEGRRRGGDQALLTTLTFIGFNYTEKKVDYIGLPRFLLLTICPHSFIPWNPNILALLTAVS